MHAQPQYAVGEVIIARLDSVTRSGGIVTKWRPRTIVWVEEVLPHSEWAAPEWPRYTLRYPDNSTGRLDESHLEPFSEAPAKPARKTSKSKAPPKAKPKPAEYGLFS